MSADNRAALVNWAEQTIARGSRSFGLASKLLPRRERENAWLLYAWCRACDDATDGQELGFATDGVAAGAAVGALDPDALTRAALSLDVAVPQAFAALREVHRDAGLPEVFIQDHLAGFALDRAGWRPRTADDLIGYCYHVAGAVGGMMAVIMGVPPGDADTLDRASDLGIAFQLDNIARDLAEDAGIGRCYVPADWLAAQGLAESTLALPEHRPALASIARQLNDLARRYRASAAVGAARLPWRCRLAILSAANIYGAIGDQVVARGASAWDSRVSTSGVTKLAAVVRALGQSFTAPADPGRVGLFNRDGWRAAGPLPDPATGA